MALPREETNRGSCLSYIMPSQSSIHNSNMIGAAFLAGAAAATGTRRMSAGRPPGDGIQLCQAVERWGLVYGEEEKYHWIDAFHTGYNLDALKKIPGGLRGQRLLGARWKKDMSISSGTFSSPMAASGIITTRRGPIDIQCASQAMDTLLSVLGGGP